MFQKILVTTDASSYSIHALTTAIDLAFHVHAEIELLHVIDYPASYRGPHLNTQSFIFSEEQIRRIDGHIMGTTLRGIDTKNILINKKIIVGNVADVIIGEMSSGGFDLVVIGTRGYSAMSGAIIGSVTQKVLSKATCPVLVVK